MADNIIVVTHRVNNGNGFRVIETTRVNHREAPDSMQFREYFYFEKRVRDILGYSLYIGDNERRLVPIGLKIHLIVHHRLEERGYLPVYGNSITMLSFKVRAEHIDEIAIREMYGNVISIFRHDDDFYIVHIQEKLLYGEHPFSLTMYFLLNALIPLEVFRGPIIEDIINLYHDLASIKEFMAKYFIFEKLILTESYNACMDDIFDRRVWVILPGGRNTLYSPDIAKVDGKYKYSFRITDVSKLYGLDFKLTRLERIIPHKSNNYNLDFIKSWDFLSESAGAIAKKYICE